MHDEMLERRLRAALRDDAHQLPFTITAAELERRLVLRDRSLGGRRLGLLLAAAVGIGLFGVGGAMGGLFDGPTPSLPAPSPVAEASDPAPTASPDGPKMLPSLDEMLASGGPGMVVLAQSHGPADGADTFPTTIELPDPFVDLGSLPGPVYEISFACLGASATFTMFDASGPTFASPSTACNGELHDQSGSVGVGQSLRVAMTGQPSWRLVVRGAPLPGPSGPPSPANVEAREGQQTLASLIDQTTEDGVELAGNPGLLSVEAGSLPAREEYQVQTSCVGGGFMRYILGDEIDGTFTAFTTTQVACDGAVSAMSFGIAQPYGGRVFVAAEPKTRWSILFSSAPPPIVLVRELPGWQLSAGAGPDLAFDTGSQAFTGPGAEGGGPVLIAVSCAGTGTIEVVVRLEHATKGQVTEDTYAQLDAPCDPGGATTSQSFATADEYIDIEWTTPAGTWIAVSILVPDPLPSRN